MLDKDDDNHLSYDEISSFFSNNNGNGATIKVFQALDFDNDQYVSLGEVKRNLKELKRKKESLEKTLEESNIPSSSPSEPSDTLGVGDEEGDREKMDELNQYMNGGKLDA